MHSLSLKVCCFAALEMALLRLLLWQYKLLFDFELEFVVAMVITY